MNKNTFESAQAICAGSRGPLSALEFWVKRAVVNVEARRFKAASIALEYAAAYSALCEKSGAK